jgi:hypothetical protein
MISYMSLFREVENQLSILLSGDNSEEEIGNVRYIYGTKAPRLFCRGW